jgi:DNA-binding response OmpR family regulator
MPQILVVDDDIEILMMIELLFKQEGYTTLKARSAVESLKLIETVTPDLLLIDVALPEVDGISLCRKLRRRVELENTPIIFLTGEDSPYGVVEALNAGGDDYVRKPFAIRELAARVRAQLRRSALNESISTVRLLPMTHQVFVNEREVELTRVEFDLLQHLCNYPDRWHTTRELLGGVWQYPQGVGDAALVRNHIRNLRRKLEDDPERPEIVQSRHRRGYIIRAHVQIGEGAIRRAL